MERVEVCRRIRLRSGVEFDASFVLVGVDQVVVTAEGREAIKVTRKPDGVWVARYADSKRILEASDRNPAKAFDVAAREAWRRSVQV